VNIDPKRTSSGRGPSKWTRRRWVQGAVLVVVLGGAGLAAWAGWFRGGDPRETEALFAVEEGPLSITITESGTIQNRDLKVVSSEVEGRAQILYLIPEGTLVKKGDLLVRLDASSLVDSKAQQEITVMNAEASWVQASENLEVTKSQAKSDESKAELDWKFAQMDLEKFQKGDYQQQLMQSDADIKIAEEELERAKKTVEDSRKLKEEDYITESELKADELDATRKGLSLNLVKEKRRLLEEYTRIRTEEELKSDVEQAEAALDRVRRKGKADIKQAEATLKAKDSEFTRQKARLTKLDEQIKKCEVTAPVDGMAVYSTTGQSGRRSMEPLAAGQEIRERQELIYLPTTASMKAEIKVHESSLTKVKRGLTVRVTVDAVPGKVFWGKVGSISVLPDGQSMWLNPDLKVYNTDIWLDGDCEGLRAGMSCQAEVFVENYEKTLYVPVTAVVRVNGKAAVYVVEGRGKQVEREVELGLDNNRMVRIVSGVEKGELVTLKPPLSTAPKETGAPEVPAAVNGGTSGEVKTTTPGTESTQTPTLPDMSQMRNMTPEEQAKFLESLTPEQRAAMQARMRSRGGRTGGGRRGGTGEGNGTGGGATGGGGRAQEPGS